MKLLVALPLCLLVSTTAFAEHPFAFDVQVLAVDANEGVAVADYDNDGWLDISAGRFLYLNPGEQGPWVARPLRVLEDRGGYTLSNGEHAYDVDGDGFTDIVTNAFWFGEVHWYKNPGKKGLQNGLLWKKNLLVDTKQTTNEVCHFFDFDRRPDGKPEYIANQWNNNKPTLIWYQNEQGDYVSHTVGPKSGHGIGFGDLNNDGRDDIIFGGGWYEQPEEGPYAKAWTYHAQWNLSMSCPMLVKDVNGDGKNDLIWGKGHDYGVYAWISKGTDDNGKFLYDEVKIDDSFSQAHALHVADLDGDGKVEIITGKRVYGHGGRDPGANDTPVVMAYTWDDGFKNIQKHVLAEGAGIGLHIRTADLDQDGDLDVVVPGKDGTQILWNKRK
ncbi:MAG: FG-GAP repeat domain-containing protein [Phycisphaeraceae bacterium]